jgi:hypothetical protein
MIFHDGADGADGALHDFAFSWNAQLVNEAKVEQGRMPEGKEEGRRQNVAGRNPWLSVSIRGLDGSRLILITRAGERQGAAAVQDAARPTSGGSMFPQVLDCGCARALWRRSLGWKRPTGRSTSKEAIPAYHRSFSRVFPRIPASRKKGYLAELEHSLRGEPMGRPCSRE